MTQVSDVVIAANPTGLAMRTEINSINTAFNTSHKGGSAPGSIAAGTFWIDDTNNPIWDYNVYDGATSIRLAKIDTTNNIIIYDAVETESIQRTLKTITSSSNTITADLADGNVFTHTFTENTTFTFSNPPASGKNGSFLLFLIQDGTGRTPTWPASVVWDTGVEPDLNVISAKYTVRFYTNDGGTIWFGNVIYTSETEAAGGSLILLKTLTASTSASFSFVDGVAGVVLDSTYKAYIVDLLTIVPVTDSTNLLATVSIDTGSTFISSGYGYYREQKLMGTGTYDASTNASASTMIIGTGVGTGTGEQISLSIRIPNPADAAKYKLISWDGGGFNDNGAGIGSSGIGVIPTTSAIDGLKFALSSDEILTGTAKLYGVL